MSNRRSPKIYFPASTLTDEEFEDATRALELVKESDGFEKLLRGEAPETDFNKFGPFGANEWELMVDIFLNDNDLAKFNENQQIEIDSMLRRYGQINKKIVD